MIKESMDCLLILLKEKCNRITLVSIIDPSGILYPDSQTGHKLVSSAL